MIVPGPLQYLGAFALAFAAGVVFTLVATVAASDAREVNRAA